MHNWNIILEANRERTTLNRCGGSPSKHVWTGQGDRAWGEGSHATYHMDMWTLPVNRRNDKQKHMTKNITFPQQTTYTGGKNVLDSTFLWRIKMLVYLPDWNTSGLQGAAQLVSLFGWNSLVVLTNHYQNRRLDLNKNDNWITHNRLHLKKTFHDYEAHTNRGLSLCHKNLFLLYLNSEKRMFASQEWISLSLNKEDYLWCQTPTEWGKMLSKNQHIIPIAHQMSTWSPLPPTPPL